MDALRSVAPTGSPLSVGSPLGILLADATGLLLQWCLFRFRGIPIAGGGGWCPMVRDGARTARGNATL